MTQQLTNHTKQESIRCNTSCRCSENTSLSAVQQVAIVMGQVWVETKSKKNKHKHVNKWVVNTPSRHLLVY